MRFRQHINEQVTPYDFTDEQKALLLKNCKPFLKDTKKRINDGVKFLYRGMTGTGGNSFIEKTVRQDRRPLDSDVRFHNDFGAGFKRKFGVDARKQGVFTEIVEVHQYGYPYIVIPQGSYYCIWSDTIQDAVEWAPDAIYDYGGEPAALKKAVDTHIDKLLKTYHKGDVNKAIKGVENSKGGWRTEIVVICKKYYAIGGRHKMYLEGLIRNEV